MGEFGAVVAWGRDEIVTTKAADFAHLGGLLRQRGGETTSVELVGGSEGVKELEMEDGMSDALSIQEI